MIAFDDANFEAEVIGSETPVLVDFTATWCGPCKRLAPVVEALAEEYAGKVKIGKFDIDASPETPARFKVMAVPTLVFFKNGKEVDLLQGLAGKEAIKSKLDALL